MKIFYDITYTLLILNKMFDELNVLTIKLKLNIDFFDGALTKIGKHLQTLSSFQNT